jgi:hypothetical protein
MAWVDADTERKKKELNDSPTEKRNGRHHFFRFHQFFQKILSVG